MEKTKFVNYRMSELSFKVNENIQPGTKFQLSPRFECKLRYLKENFTAQLTIKINEDISSMPTPFELKLTLLGSFIMGDDLKDDRREQLKFAVDTLFPYARSIVSNITLSGNLPPCILPFIDAEQMAQNMHDDSLPKSPTDLN